MRSVSRSPSMSSWMFAGRPLPEHRHATTERTMMSVIPFFGSPLDHGVILRSELIPDGAGAQLTSPPGGPSTGSEDGRPTDLLRQQPTGHARSAVTRKNLEQKELPWRMWAVGPAGPPR